MTPKIDPEALSPAVRELLREAMTPRAEALPPIAQQVAAVERRAEKALALAGEILATLTLEQNQHWFQRMPEDWHMMVKAWEARYRRLAPDEGGEAP